MTRVVGDPGICGFNAIIEVVRLSAQRVRVTVASDCEMISKIGGQLVELDWRIFLREEGNYKVYKSVFQCIRDIACPVPLAIYKATEVEIGAALPKDVVIRFESTNHG